MATYTFGGVNSLGLVNIVSTTILTSQSVTLNQVFSGLSIPTDDDYRLRIKLTNIVLDNTTLGPFVVISGNTLGDESVIVSSGDASNFTASGTIIIKDGLGNENINQVRSDFSGGSIITLDERLLIDVPTTTSTIERVPRIEITGTVGTGSGATDVFTEVIWLTERDNFSGLWFSRLKYDHATTFSVATFGFTGTIEIIDWISLENIYHADRRTKRDITGLISGDPTNLAFPNPFLSNGAGHKGGTKGFSVSILDMERYAEQHYPLRLFMNIIFGFGINGTFSIHGFKTIWSPIRENVNSSATSIKISAENLNQFAPNDVITLYDLTNDIREDIPISTLTSPDTLNLVSGTINSYTVDDVLGIWQTETVSVTTVGNTYTKDAWVYPLEYSTTSLSSFFRTINSSVQGLVGTLLTGDNRYSGSLPAGVFPRNNVGVYSSTTSSIQVQANTAFGSPQEIMCLPRGTTNLLTQESTNSIIALGYKDKFGNALVGPTIIRGSLKSNNLILTNQDMGFIAFRTKFLNRKIINDDEGGRSSFSNFASLKLRSCESSTPGFYSLVSNDIQVRDCINIADRANSIVPEPIASLFPGAFLASTVTTNQDLVRVKDIGGGGVQALVGFTGIDIIINEYNNDILNNSGGNSKKLFILNFGNTVIQVINSEFSELEMDSSQVGFQKINSVSLLDLIVVNENNEPLAGSSVLLLDVFGNIVINTTTDEFGKIPITEMVTHSWFRDLSTGTNKISWFVADPPPSPIVRTIFSPFDLIISENPGKVEGYTPAHNIIDIKPLLTNSTVKLTIILHVPRPDGQFGDAGFGTF